MIFMINKKNRILKCYLTSFTIISIFLAACEVEIDNLSEPYYSGLDEVFYREAIADGHEIRSNETKIETDTESSDSDIYPINGIQVTSEFEFALNDVSIYKNRLLAQVWESGSENWGLNVLNVSMYYPQVFFDDINYDSSIEAKINELLESVFFSEYSWLLEAYALARDFEAGIVEHGTFFVRWSNYEILAMTDKLVSIYFIDELLRGAGRLQTWDHHITVDLTTGRLKDLFDIVYAESILASFEEGRYTVFTGLDQRNLELDKYLAERYREIIEENLYSSDTHNSPHADVRNFGIDEDYIYVFIPTLSTHGWYGRLILQIAHEDVVFK